MWLCDFELCGMVKRKYPGLIVCCVEIITSILLCPTLWRVGSENPSIVCLNDSEGGSFVETVVLPWFLRELVISSLVDSVQLSKFLFKAFHKESFMLAHIDQTIWGSKCEWRRFSSFLDHIFRLRLLWYLRRLWLCLLLPKEIILSRILLLFLFLEQVVVEKVKLL